MTKPIKVMVIDDSAVMGQVMSEMLELDPDIRVTAVETDADVAYSRLRESWPDVIVLDADIPRLDSIGFLQRIMNERPTPIVVSATPSDTGSRISVAALSRGAVQVVTKPRTGLKHFLKENSADLIAEVKVAALSQIDRMTPLAVLNIPPKLGEDAVIGPMIGALPLPQRQLVGVGAATGGLQALERLLAELPRLSPGMVIVQHMPGHLTSALVQHLDAVCDVDVKMAAHGDRIRTGLALLAPAGRHLQIKADHAGYYVALSNGVPVNGCKPAIDVMFRSIANVCGKHGLGIVLSGTGHDGVRGLKALRDAGALTLAEDEASSIMHELPRNAVAFGGIVRSVHCRLLAREVLNYAERVLN